MSGRPWSEQDRELVRQWYKQRPTRWLARQLQRSEAAVRLEADLLGLAKRRSVPAGLLDFIRDRHAAGLLDTEIHREYVAKHPDAFVCRESVANYRRGLLGLPVNQARRREVRRAGYEKQMQILGIASFNVLAQRRQRRVAIEAGLPLDLRPLEVRVFQVLRAGGFWTREEIAERLGQEWKTQRSWFKCRYGTKTALGNLVDRGLVRRTEGRTRKLGGKGRTAREYWVPLDVLRRLPQRRACIA